MGLHRGLTFLGTVFGLGQFGDGLRGVAEREQFTPAGGSSVGSKNS
jgi:hypothetical protein